MKKSIVTAIFCIALTSAAHAHGFTVGTLEILHPWTRAASGKVGGGFFKIVNKGTETDRLKSGSVEIAGKFEIHVTTMVNGVAQMRPIPPEGLEIKPGETVEFKPGSYHVMFMDLRQPIKPGDVVKGTLVFEKAGTVKVEYKVETKAPAMGDHSGH